jgi:hypothetical protein
MPSLLQVVGAAMIREGRNCWNSFDRCIVLLQSIPTLTEQDGPVYAFWTYAVVALDNANDLWNR